MPYPPNYGGVIDVYYKLYWLKQQGIKIHLHCFVYGRNPAKALEDLCESVHYYERNTGLMANLSVLPYTVISRRSKALEENLLANDFPILFEVLHTCYLLKDKRFAGRKKIYRHSNIEHAYYSELAKSEKNFLKKVFLQVEAVRLKLFEPIIRYADLILAVNKKDTAYFQKNYPEVKSVYLPSFHSNLDVSVKEGRGDYILFHGNLSISENYEAITWLIQNVFSKINYQVIVAGLNPPLFLQELIGRYQHIRLRSNPNEEEMVQLIRNAQIHVLYTKQPTGLKLKLLQVMFKGRIVVCNRNMISGTDLKATNTLRLAESPEEYLNEIKLCFQLEMSNTEIGSRKQQILQFTNADNCKKLILEVFGENEKSALN